MLSENARSSARLNLNSKTAGLWTLDLNDGELVTKHIIDLSSTGIALKVPGGFELKKGQIIDVKLTFSFGQRTLKTKGQVMWFKRASETRTGIFNHVGIHFTEKNLELDQVVTGFINSTLLQERAGSAGQHFQYEKRESVKAQSALGVISLAVLIGMFLTVAFFHEKMHPEQALSKQIEMAPIWKNLKFPSN